MARFSNLDAPRQSRVQWETREITMPQATTRQEAKALLTEYAEYGHWERACVGPNVNLVAMRPES